MRWLTWLLLVVVLAACTGPGSDTATTETVPRHSPTDHVTGPGAPSPTPPEALVDAVPDARLVSSTTSGLLVWIAGPTDVYPHGALGDEVEGTQVRVLDPATGATGRWSTPEGTVLEELRPRFTDVDGDGREEILVVVTDLALGASVALLDVDLPDIELLAQGPPIGRANRWLNPLPPVDIDDEVAYVETPHIGGHLVVSDLVDGRLREVSRIPGFSNHAYGSPEQDLALAVDDGTGRVAWLLPVDGRERMVLVDADDPGEIVTGMELPRPAVGPIDSHSRTIVLDDGTPHRLPDDLARFAAVIVRDDVVGSG